MIQTPNVQFDIKVWVFQRVLCVCKLNMDSSLVSISTMHSNPIRPMSFTYFQDYYCTETTWKSLSAEGLGVSHVSRTLHTSAGVETGLSLLQVRAYQRAHRVLLTHVQTRAHRALPVHEESQREWVMNTETHVQINQHAWLCFIYSHFDLMNGNGF